MIYKKKTEKTSNLKAHNNEKMAVKEKEKRTIFQHHLHKLSQKHKYLQKIAEYCKNQIF